MHMPIIHYTCMGFAYVRKKSITVSPMTKAALLGSGYGQPNAAHCKGAYGLRRTLSREPGKQCPRPAPPSAVALNGNE